MLTKMALWFCVVSVLLIQLGQAENVVALRRHHHLRHKSHASLKSVADLYKKYGIDATSVTAKGSGDAPISFVAPTPVSDALKAIKFTAATGAADFSGQATVMIKGVNMKQQAGTDSTDTVTARLKALCTLVHDMAAANPNIGDCYAFTTEGDYFVSVMEYAKVETVPAWSVTKLMKHNQPVKDVSNSKRLHKSPTLDVSYAVATQMAGILSTLESFSVVHPALTLRDSVLLTKGADNAVMLKLVSFGQLSFLPGVARNYPDLKDVIITSQATDLTNPLSTMVVGQVLGQAMGGDSILQAGRELAKFTCGERERKPKEGADGKPTDQTTDVSPTPLEKVVDRQSMCTYVTRQCGAVSMCSENPEDRKRITNLWEIINLMIVPDAGQRITPTALKQNLDQMATGADASVLWPGNSVKAEKFLAFNADLDMYFSRCFVATFNKNQAAPNAQATLADDTKDVCDLACGPTDKARAVMKDGEKVDPDVQAHADVCTAPLTPSVGKKPMFTGDFDFSS